MTEQDLLQRIAELEQKRNNIFIALGETQGMIRAYTEMLNQLRAPRPNETRVGEEIPGA